MKIFRAGHLEFGPVAVDQGYFGLSRQPVVEFGMAVNQRYRFAVENSGNREEISKKSKQIFLSRFSWHISLNSRYLILLIILYYLTSIYVDLILIFL